MKIMMVHPHDVYHDMEPWTVRITYLALELVRAGHEVQLVYHLFDPHRDVPSASRRQEFPFRTIPLHRDPRKLFHNFSRMEKIAHWADIVHFQKCSNYAAVPAVAAAYYQGRPIHYDWDDWEQAIFEKDNKNPVGSWIYFQQMEKHLLKVVDTVSTASKGIQALSQKMSFPDDRTFYIPVGADMDVFSPRVDGTRIRKEYGLDKKIVLYQGQLSGSNYVYLFLRAAEKILNKRDDVHFVVVGGGDKLDDAVKVARDCNIGDKVLFTNRVPHKQVPQFIASADVVVASFENNSQVICKSPLKVIEYMASGKAIVASRVGEVPDMIGDSGILTDPSNSTDMAEAVEMLLENSRLRLELGRKARLRAQKMFSWKNSAGTLTQAYHTALKYHHGL
jgi:glycosyltransferase involved in cell wall biosynthesis